MAAPLDKRSKKGEPAMFQVNDEQRQTVDNLRKKLASLPVLALPRPDGKSVIKTDACDKQVVCVLLHEKVKASYDP